MSGKELGGGAIVLVVFVVILAVVLMRQREGAEAAGASRNLQQWGIALNLYLIDNGNQLPETGSAPVSADQERAWYNALPPYISRKPLTALAPEERPRPGVPSLWIAPGSEARRLWDPDQFYFNYAMNRYLQPDPEVRSFRIYELDRPGNVLFLVPVDGHSPAAGPGDVVFREADDSESPVLFCDGHVRALPRSAFVDNPAALKAERANEGGVSWFAE